MRTEVRRENQEYDEDCRNELMSVPPAIPENECMIVSPWIAPTTISSISVRTTKSKKEDRWLFYSDLVAGS
jgi:hypothetical protein